MTKIGCIPITFHLTIYAIIDFTATYLFSAHFGTRAAFIGYDLYVVLATWIFLNTYYQLGIGLDMAYFWKNVLPIILVCVVAAGISFIGTHILPMPNIGIFLFWSIFYTFVYIVLIWVFALSSDKKSYKKYREKI